MTKSTQILFITATRIGDAVLSTGLIDHLLKTVPNPAITIVCGKLPRSLFGGVPHLQRIIALEKKPYHGHWFGLWRETIGIKWDVVVDLRNSAVSRLIRARARYCFGPHINSKLHKVEQAAQVMKLTHVPTPKLWFTPAQIERARTLVPEGAPVLAIGPTANWAGKTWPAERFIDVMRWMIASGGVMQNARVAVFAAPGEEKAAYDVLQAVPEGQRIDVIAKGNPAEGAAALARCQFYIGNDSGLMHCAAACGVPTFGLFGPSYPHLYRPWGAHTAYAQTPESFDELINFEGYHPKTVGTLMNSLSVPHIQDALKKFFNAQNIQAT